MIMKCTTLAGISFWNYFTGFDIKYTKRHGAKNIVSLRGKAITRKNSTFTISSAKSMHQGGDFILEGKVKRQKMLSSKGTDDEKMWRKVYRSLEYVIEVTKNVNERLTVHDIDGERYVNLTADINSLGAIIRHSTYLTSNLDKHDVYSIYGDKLSDDLINFPEKLKEKMMEYWEQIEQGVKPEKLKMKQLLVVADTYMEDLSYSEVESEEEDT